MIPALLTVVTIVWDAKTPQWIVMTEMLAQTTFAVETVVVLRVDVLLLLFLVMTEMLAH